MQGQYRFSFDPNPSSELSPLLSPPVYDPGPVSPVPRDPYIFYASDMAAIAAAADEPPLRSQPLGSLRSARPAPEQAGVP